jgi:pimeloyl-ACP methyl ester carboxylesterase
MPALCLIPGLDGLGLPSLEALAWHLVDLRMVALLVLPDQELFKYPDMLATLPSAMAALSKRPEVDPERIGALGYDLGADLVIRSAGADKQLAAVAALAPSLESPPVGLQLMTEMSYPQAWRWARSHKRAELQRDLKALEYAARIHPRPLLLMYGTWDRLVAHDPTAQGEARYLPSPLLEQVEGSVTLRIISDAGHLDLLQQPDTLESAVRWFKEHL